MQLGFIKRLLVQLDFVKQISNVVRFYEVDLICYVVKFYEVDQLCSLVL